MNSVQRAWRCVVRKPIKSLLLLFVIAAINLFILCGVACRNASVQTQDNTRQAVGAGLRLDANEKNRTKRMIECSNKIGADVEGSYGGVHQKKIETVYGTQWSGWTDHSFDTLQLYDIEQLASVPGISDYNISTYITPVYPKNFNRIEDPDADQYNDIGGVCLIGNRKMELDFNVLSGNVTIKEGRMIQSSDENVCVISEQLAVYSMLSIGDTLQFNDFHDPDNAKIFEAVIIGIYQTGQFMTPIMSGDTYRSENIIFTDLRFPEKAEGCENDPLFEHAYFQVGNADEYDKVKAAVQNAEIDWERYDLIDRNGNMTTMSENFNDLEKISTALIVVSFIAGFIILFLVFVFWTKNRKNEMGILLSIGCRKISIIGQLFLEGVFIAVLSFGLTFALAPAASSAAADYLVADQVERAQIQEQMDADKVAGGKQSSQNQTVMGVTVNITPDMLIFCAASVILLIGISIEAAGIQILIRNPRDILSKLS